MDDDPFDDDDDDVSKHKRSAPPAALGSPVPTLRKSGAPSPSPASASSAPSSKALLPRSRAPMSTAGAVPTSVASTTSARSSSRPNAGPPSSPRTAVSPSSSPRSSPRPVAAGGGSNSPRGQSPVSSPRGSAAPTISQSPRGGSPSTSPRGSWVSPSTSPRGSNAGSPRASAHRSSERAEEADSPISSSPRSGSSSPRTMSLGRSAGRRLSPRSQSPPPPPPLPEALPFLTSPPSPASKRTAPLLISLTDSPMSVYEAIEDGVVRLCTQALQAVGFHSVPWRIPPYDAIQKRLEQAHETYAGDEEVKQLLGVLCGLFADPPFVFASSSTVMKTFASIAHMRISGSQQEDACAKLVTQLLEKIHAHRQMDANMISALLGVTICSAVTAGAVDSVRDIAVFAGERCQWAVQPHWWHQQLALYGVPNRDPIIRKEVKSFLREAGRLYREDNFNGAIASARQGLRYDPCDPGCNRVVSTCLDAQDNPFCRNVCLEKLMEEIGWQCLTRLSTNQKLEDSLKVVVPSFSQMTSEQRRRSAFLGLLFKNWISSSSCNEYRVVPIEKSISSASGRTAISRDDAQGAAMGGRSLHSVRALSGGPRAPTWLGEEVWSDTGHGAWIHEFCHLAHYSMEKARDADSKALVQLIKDVYAASTRDRRILPSLYAGVNQYEFFAEVMRCAIRQDPISTEARRISTTVIELSGLSSGVKQKLLGGDS